MPPTMLAEATVMGNEVSLVELARSRSREERLILLRELLSDFSDKGGLSVIPTPGGRYVWSYYVPYQFRTPPELSPEEEAELQRRLDTIDDAVDAEEFMAEFDRWAQETDPRS